MRGSLKKPVYQLPSMEDIKKIRRHDLNDGGGQETIYKVTKNDVLENTEF